MTSHPLGKVFETTMEQRRHQIPDEEFLMRKKKENKRVSKDTNTETFWADMLYIFLTTEAKEES